MSLSLVLSPDMDDINIVKTSWSSPRTVEIAGRMMQFDTLYIGSNRGVIKVIEIVLCFISMILVGYSRPVHNERGLALIVSSNGIVLSFVLLLSYILTLNTRIHSTRWFIVVSIRSILFDYLLLISNLMKRRFLGSDVLCTDDYWSILVCFIYDILLSKPLGRNQSYLADCTFISSRHMLHQPIQMRPLQLLPQWLIVVLVKQLVNSKTAYSGPSSRYGSSQSNASSLGYGRAASTPTNQAAKTLAALTNSSNKTLTSSSYSNYDAAVYAAASSYLQSKATGTTNMWMSKKPGYLSNYMLCDNFIIYHLKVFKKIVFIVSKCVCCHRISLELLFIQVLRIAMHRISKNKKLSKILFRDGVAPKTEGLEDGAVDAPRDNDRLLKGVMRVGLLSKGLLLKGDKQQFNLFVIRWILLCCVHMCLHWLY
uniref:G_PROTEIN_RECEP_F1_2 domain-containing protein n=1 Tax=Heterorhabditis bacteriophora TaxID=37862 RepID=A0A1I7WNZ4_HETBA